MATLNLTLDTRRALKDKTYPIKVSMHFSDKGQIMFNLGISVRKDHWNGQYVIKSQRKDVLNNFLRYRYNVIAKEIQRLERSGELAALTLPQIKKIVSAAANMAPEPVADGTLIRSAFESFAASARAERTKSIYKQTLSKLDTAYDLDNLRFTDINNKWLRGWEESMYNDGLSTNAISVHLRNLRAVFNRAIDDDVISQEMYPFRKFKIKSERTAKRSLSVDELRSLMHYPCEPHLCKYRDYFMLILYLMGINFVDLARLSSIKNGRINYRRAKTGRLYSIKVEPEASEIIERYKGENTLVDILDRNVDYHNFLARTNEGLKKIGIMTYVENAAKDPSNVKRNKKSVTPLFHDLSTYTASHITNYYSLKISPLPRILR